MVAAGVAADEVGEMPQEVVVVVFTAVVGGTIVLSQLIRTIGRHLERTTSKTDPSALASLQQGLTELQASVETLRHQVGEVEERVDFTERLMTRERQQERLQSGRETGT